MIVDSAKIFVSSGKGGNGCLSFRREKYIAKGGPDGGDGGDGGSVILKASPDVETLLDFAGRHHWKADKGQPGMGKNMHGKAADDLTVNLPIGTLVYNDDTGELIVDLTDEGQEYTIAKGGKGGRGNDRFKTPTNQVPTEWEPGGEAEEFNLRFELKLIADVGLVGKPNAGKSTFLSAVSDATPKIADYPFTTLTPQLGIASIIGNRRLVIADIPGLIADAHLGTGLGHQFLRHVERTRLLLHIIEIEPTDNSDPIENYHTIRQELDAYSSILGDKPEVLALSKLDLLGTKEDQQVAIELIQDHLGTDRKIFPISSATGQGTEALLEECWRLLRDSRDRDQKGWGRDDEADAYDQREENDS
ncbi:GTPase Obg [Poriferisphaera corsica]|uniref:GTPase Obg n=1 Tax=Poriferisphaera corsica TaxID=2528020 RepID=A0A517YQB7_9BACT|nr:GTPase ObgE [Poriferisphaera corsica]QDU32415.1 GTPase Obg [Poriferisphaera corsica]